jgi:hypothetical protein
MKLLIVQLVHSVPQLIKLFYHTSRRYNVKIHWKCVFTLYIHFQKHRTDINNILYSISKLKIRLLVPLFSHIKLYDLFPVSSNLNSELLREQCIWK